MAQPAPPQNLEQIAGQAPKATPKKEPFNLERTIKKYSAQTEAFGGSLFRSATTTYNAALALPIMVANPIVGLGYAVTMGLVSYVTSNILWKFGKMAVDFTYNMAIHPLNTIKKGIWKLASLIPGAKLLNSFASKLKITENKEPDRFEGVDYHDAGGIAGFFFTPATSSKAGALVGQIAGGAAALNVLSPEGFEKLFGKVADTVVPYVKDTYQGIAAAGGKTIGLAEAVKDAAVNYYQGNIQNAYSF